MLPAAEIVNDRSRKLPVRGDAIAILSSLCRKNAENQRLFRKQNGLKSLLEFLRWLQLPLTLDDC